MDCEIEISITDIVSYLRYRAKPAALELKVKLL